MMERASKVASGFFITINGESYVKNGRTVFSRREATQYKSVLSRKHPDLEVRMFGVHPLVAR